MKLHGAPKTVARSPLFRTALLLAAGVALALSFAGAVTQPALAVDGNSSAAASEATSSSSAAPATSASSAEAGSQDAAPDASSSAASASSDASSEGSPSKEAPSTTSVDDDAENRVDPTQRADNSFIYDTTIESLFNESSLYEGRTVQVVGEAIGDLIQANDGERNCWVTLTSIDVENPSSISVLMSADQAQQIDHFGRYGVTGTRLQVRGVFHQSCSEHDGLPDIHATNSAVIQRGFEHPDEFKGSRYVPGIVAVLIGGVLMALYYFVRERTR